MLTTNRSKSIYFLIAGIDVLVLKTDTGLTFPTANHLKTLGIDSSAAYFVCHSGDKNYYVLALDKHLNVSDFKYKDITRIFSMVQEREYSLLLKALHLLKWFRKNKHCCLCGEELYHNYSEHKLICSSCGERRYPSIYPAVLVAILKDNQLLMVRSKHYPPGIFSLISGFVDPGETLEECVAREVQEEVGLKVKNLRYFGSHPWPFSSSIMVGFIADYAEGVISLDTNELECAQWFSIDNLPEMTDRLSFARTLIDSLI